MTGGAGETHAIIYNTNDSLYNSVKEYHRHLFISTPTPAKEWPHDAHTVSPIISRIHDEIKRTKLKGVQLTVFEKVC